MPQRLAADQHSSLVQLLARFILAASVDVALISFSGPLIHPVKWNFADLSRMSFVDGNCIIRAVTVNVRALVNELPNLFIGRRVLHPVNDLRLILPYNGAYTLPAAFSVPHMDEILTVKHSRVLQHLKPLRVARRSLLLWNFLKCRDLRFDLFPCHQIRSLQICQLTAPQSGSPAEFYQLIVVSFREVPIPLGVSPAPFDF